MILAASCSYTKVVKPELQSTPCDLTKFHQKDEIKYSYYTYSSHAVVMGDKRLEPAEYALLESFSKCGIRDVLKSESFLDDRINIIIYMFDSKVKSGYTGGYFGGFWNVLAMWTLTIFPSYFESRQPVEILVINPKREDKQITTVHTEYVSEIWTWLPFAFKTPGYASSKKDAYYPGLSPTTERPEQAVLRQIFEQVILESANSQ